MTVSDLVNAGTWAGLSGFALPPIVARLNARSASKRTRTLVALGLSLAAACIVTAVTVPVTAKNLAAVAMVTFAAMRVAYKGLYQPLGAPTWEELTSPQGERQDAARGADESGGAVN